MGIWFFFNVKGDKNNMKDFKLNLANIRLKRAVVDKKMYDVIESKDIYKEKDLDNTNAIHHENYILPLMRTYNQKTIGVYITDEVSVINLPETDDDKRKYSDENMIDLASDSTKEYIKKKRELQNMEENILYSDNPNHYVIMKDDSPEMKCLKRAINMKSIDIHNYEHRFGDKFQNTIRLLNKGNISLQKLKEFAESLDFKLTLTIEDKNEEVANPMKGKVSMELTGLDNIEEGDV